MELLASLSLYSRVMLGVCAALLLIILMEVLLLGGESGAAVTASNTQDQGSAAPGAVPQSLQIPPVVAYREVTERPLFSDSRRPPPQDKAAANSAVRATQLVGKWKVTGIVVAGDSSFAHVEGIRDRKTVRLQLGAPLDGWQLEEIHPDHLVFNSADTTATLLLHDEDNPPSPPRR